MYLSFYYSELYGVTFLPITFFKLKVLGGKFILSLYDYVIICTVRCTAGYQQHRGSHCSTEEESCSFSPFIDGNSPGIRHCTSSAFIATFSGCSHLLKCSSLLLSMSPVPIYASVSEDSCRNRSQHSFFACPRESNMSLDVTSQV